MALKDFSILLEKINVNSTKKDISLVSGFNAYTQYIESVCKTQKGELISNMDLGSDYFAYIFDGQADIGALEVSMAAYIQAAIPDISNVSVSVEYASDTNFQFLVNYELSNGISKQSKANAFIEVDI
jgi:hypothetical protein